MSAGASTALAHQLASLGARVRERVPLAGYTTWRVGGPAEYFVEPESAEAAARLCAFCRAEGVPLTFLGRGSNTLVDSAGLPGVVLCTKNALQAVERRGDVLWAQGGVPLPKVAKTAAALGFGGFEFLIGIPGTVGGGVVMNAGVSPSDGAGGGELRELLDGAVVAGPDGRPEALPASGLELEYRGSVLAREPRFVLEATFRLERPDDPAVIRRRSGEQLAERKRKQPLTRNTAGSTFKQPAGGRPAGWYLDRAGVKGERVGGAAVSGLHANWIETDEGAATSDDVRRLMERMRERVRGEFGVELEREVRFLPGDMGEWE